MIFFGDIAKMHEMNVVFARTKDLCFSMIPEKCTSIVDASFKAISKNTGYQLLSSYTVTPCYVDLTSASKDKT